MAGKREPSMNRDEYPRPAGRRSFVRLRYLAARGQIVPVSPFAGDGRAEVVVRASRLRTIYTLTTSVPFFIAGIGLLVGGGGGLLDHWLTPVDPIVLLVLGLAFSVLSGLDLFPALVAALRSMSVVIGGGRVDITLKGPFVSTRRKLSIAEFEGVQLTCFHIRNYYDSGVYMYRKPSLPPLNDPHMFAIHLVHPQPELTIPLFFGKLKHWENHLEKRYARHLGLQLLPQARETKLSMNPVLLGQHNNGGGGGG